MINYKKNRSKKYEVCYDCDYGVLVRTPGTKYFYQKDEKQLSRMPSDERTHVLLADIPIEIIKASTAPRRREGSCFKCHNTFLMSELEGNVCRSCFCNYGSEEERYQTSIFRFAGERSCGSMEQRQDGILSRA